MSDLELKKVSNEALVIAQLEDAFKAFEVRSEKLSNAYESMQSEFKKVNVELDKKNHELAESLHIQDEMQSYLNSILESMNSGVIAVDDNEIITIFNKVAEEITGYSREELINKKFTDFFKGRELSKRCVVDVLNSGKKFSRDEKVLWTKESKPIPISFQASLLRDNQGRRIGAVEIFNDISKIKELENEMQQNKTMVALGEMSATVAHEIRNPLGAMGVWAGLLDRDFEKSDPRRETLAKITSALGRLNKIVSNLLVYSRPI